MKKTIVLRLFLTFTWAGFIPEELNAVINQVDGTVVPQNYTAEMQQCLDRSEGAGVLDAVFDADIQPEVYLPVAGVTIHFIVQAEGAGYRNSFGWYNVGDDVSDPSNLHVIFPCRTTSSCPCDSCDSSLWRHAYLDISADPNYKGGYIGFWLRTPELLAGGRDPDNCGDATDVTNRIYFTQKLLNDDGDYVHFIVYTSITYSNGFYFGFEDLFRGGDNDFEDMFVFVDGLIPSCIPRVEQCDGIDNDCDTLIDDNLERPCSTACGTGVEVCTDGVWQSCSAPTPSPEVCDGVDNNCDGEIDEGLERSCSTICGSGTEYCVMGSWVDCTAPTPQEEVCNGIDDDCDTLIDEGNPGGGAPCGTDVGACDYGVESCVGGVIVCSGGIGPQIEVCNGIDDDCDGEVDEEDPGGGEVCGTDVGLCRSGVIHCVDGELICVGEVRGSPEQCNGLDDDCDGEVDEGNPGGGAPCGISTGECQPGIETCIDGTIVCVGGRGPEAEVCDGLDNDCNGLIDDGDPGGGDVCGSDVGECRSGILHCVDGSLQCVGSIGPQPERCNGLDDDCDGVIDNGDPGGGQQCGTEVGACTKGEIHCIDGRLECVGGIMPQEEVCNGIDDDCDGLVDENNPGGGLPCGTDEGECEPGITWCSSSELPPPCTPPDPLPDPPQVLCLCTVEPTEEVCDCLDNDCNGLIDDGLPLGEECGTDVGECQKGRYICLECEWKCSYNVGPSPEVCDCLDNDCNGATDDGNICGEGICYHDESSCYCALPCDPSVEFPCPTGKICADVEGYDSSYCINDPCEGIECPSCRQMCIGGQCIDRCELKTCPEGQICTYSGCQAICAPQNCYLEGYECEEGQRCEMGKCADDPCWGVECGETQFCRDGICYNSCSMDIVCPEGQICHDGECIEDKCYGVVCSGGRVCDPDTGMCKADDCAGVYCPPPQICVDGKCTDDPCYYIKCPDGYVCLGDTCFEEADQQEEGQRYLVTSTGGGGCAGCSIEGNANGAGLLPLWVVVMWFTLVTSFIKRRKFLIVTKAGLLVFALVLYLLLAGCHTGYQCIGNCDGDEDSSTYDGTTDGGDGYEMTGETTEDPLDMQKEGYDANEECDPFATEKCNGVDDDCDTLIDEDFDLQSDPQNCGQCGHKCELPHAFSACVEGRCVVARCDYNYYDCTPDDPSNSETLGCETLCFKTRDTDDICNNKDDDCNCLVDDLVDMTSDPDNCGGCGHKCNPPNSIGICVSEDGTVEAAHCEIESCNEGYWDIDGDYSNGCEYECTRCERIEGECEPGKTCCTTEGDETCNGLDDDCDGLVDEGNPGGGGACGTDEGQCSHGRLECADGVLRCVGAIEPTEEVCDGLDNDCDGLVDEDDPEGGAPCGTDAGECEAGVEHCVDGHIECIGGIGPSPELCNGLDDDCDGIVDDGNPEGGTPCGTDVGVCEFGTYKCIGGAVVCDGGIGPSEEVCDGLDNDCDGEVDEDDPLAGTVCGSSVGQCSTGIYQCIDGNLVCFGEIAPTPERCNGVDDDCDGLVDEDDPEGGGRCGTDVGQCTSGIIHCVDGRVVCTGETPPQPEVCDGLDNDCDGDVDEGASGEGIRCGTNRGTCEYGVTRCVGGRLECVGEVGPVSPEPCDGLDNDCDGTVDNNLAPPSFSCLTAGVCSGTSPVCDGSAGYNCHYPSTYQSVETWCDGLDNDCDGNTDEGCPVFAPGDIRLDVGSAAGSANSTQISVARGGDGEIHVVYIDRRNGRADIYYNHSFDGGLSWLDPDIRLDTDTAGASSSVLPDIACGRGDNVYTVWSDFRASNTYRNIYTVVSSSDGSSWSSPDVRIDTGLDTDSYGVDVAADLNGYVYVVYENLRPDRSRYIYFSRSTNDGASWETPVRVDHNPAPAPAIASSPGVATDGSGRVYVLWRDNRHGNGAIYFNYSTDYGVTWQVNDIRIETDSPPSNAHSDNPRIAAEPSGGVYVVWEDYRNGYADIYFRGSSDGASSWYSSDVRLDRDTLGHDSLRPQIVAGGSGRIYVVWEDLRNGLGDIYLNSSTNGGVSWLSEDIRIDADTAGTGSSQKPSIDVEGDFVVVAWQDSRSGDFDIYTNFSINGGESFQPSDFRVDSSSDVWDAVDVVLLISGGDAHFVWVDYRNGSHYNGDIYTRALRR